MEDDMINQEQFKKLWPEIKVGLIGVWGRLENDELENTEGDFAAISSLVQEKYGEGWECIQEKLDKLLLSFDNATDKGLDPGVSSYQRNPMPNEYWNGPQ